MCYLAIFNFVYIVSLVVLDRYEHHGQFAAVDVFPPYLLGPLDAKLLIGSKKSWMGEKWHGSHIHSPAPTPDGCSLCQHFNTSTTVHAYVICY